MGVPGYSPLDIATSLIPKRWLDTPMVSFNDADAEYQKLQQQTALADATATKAKVDKAKADANQEIATNFQKKRDDNVAGGGDGTLSDDEMYGLVRDANLKYGQGDDVVKTLLAQDKLDAEQTANEARANKKDIKAVSPQSDIYEVDDQGNMVLKQKGTPKPEKDKVKIPFKVYNPTTQDEQTVADDADWAVKYADGYTVKEPNTLPPSEVEFQKMQAGKNKGKVSTVSPDNSTPPPSDTRAGDSPMDFTLPPGSRILSDPKNPSKKVAKLPDGTYKPLP